MSRVFRKDDGYICSALDHTIFPKQHTQNPFKNGAVRKRFCVFVCVCFSLNLLKGTFDNTSNPKLDHIKN